MHSEVLYQLEKERLEQFRQDTYLHSLITQQKPSLRSRLAKALYRLALRLYPEVETRSVSLHRSSSH